MNNSTTDGGESWGNVSDGFFGGSIGAVAVSEWDPNVVYVGGGEKTVRGNVGHGDGLWRSDDAGKTWRGCCLGLQRAGALEPWLSDGLFPLPACA